MSASQRIYETGDGTAGFLDIPAGTFQPDPSSSLKQASSGQYFLGVSPALPGSFFTPRRSWDAAAKHWLPVPPQQVAADGASYVYQAGPELHLVTVATGLDKVVTRQPSGVPPLNWAGPQLLSFTAGGVYFSVNATYGGQVDGSVVSIPADQVGVWRFDVASGVSRRVLAVSVTGLLSADSASLWAIAGDGGSPSTGKLMRYDLKTGDAIQWFSVSGSGMDLLALGATGNPLVWTYDYQGNLKIWTVSAPNTSEAIDSESYSGYVPFYAGNNFEFGPLITDQHGIWFGSTEGLFLDDQTGLHSVAKATGIPVGQCV